jgi:hypothetical protein
LFEEGLINLYGIYNVGYQKPENQEIVLHIVSVALFILPSDKAVILQLYEKTAERLADFSLLNEVRR